MVAAVEPALFQCTAGPGRCRASRRSEARPRDRHCGMLHCPARSTT